jgi:hypothetical protein
MKEDKNLTHEHVKNLAEQIEKARTGVVITGRVVNGKVIVDQSSLDAVAKKFPDGNGVFIAVNAPFDPVTSELVAA